MARYRSKPISCYFRPVYFIQGTPLYPTEMFRFKPISLSFRAVYFHPRYTIVSYKNVHVQTHFTLIQGCIFSSKVQCVHTASGPNFTTTEPSRRPSWNLAPVNSYFVPSLSFCQSIWITWEICRHQSPNPQFVWWVYIYIWPHKQVRFSFGGSKCSFPHWEMMGWWWWQAGLGSCHLWLGS